MERGLPDYAGISSESEAVDFKRSFEPSSNASWCELVKDLVAMANSDGGVILFGLNDDGSCSGSDLTDLRALDAADISNRVSKYTGVPFGGFQLRNFVRDGHNCVAMEIVGAPVPMVFVKPGTYLIDDGKQKTAFSQGTLYFRHGTKSEHGTVADLIRWRDRELEKIRSAWLDGIKQVVEAPPNHRIVALPQIMDEAAIALPARLSNEPDAISVIPRNAEELWPLRQKDVIRILNDNCDYHRKITTHDIQSINKTYRVGEVQLHLSYKPHASASRQFGDSYVSWIRESLRNDPQFIERARTAYRAGDFLV